MSFLQEVKEEVLYYDNKKSHCYIAEMHGLLNQNFKINVSNSISLSIISDNKYFVNRFLILMKDFFKEDFEVKVQKNKNVKRPYTYFIFLPSAIGFLTKNKMFQDNAFIFNASDIISKRCCKASYIRGEFFICGAFSDPNKNYHLEFKKNDEKSALKLKKILNSFNLNAKIVKRRSSFVVYIKEIDKISDVLKLIGAHNKVLELESLFVLKNMKNNINRKQNCEMANLNKTITASVKQINDITYIYENYGKSVLEDDLIDVCNVRLENLDLSLVELGKLLDPPLSKSSVNYKLKKISKIADNLRRNNNGWKKDYN